MLPPPVAVTPEILLDHPIPTWFGIGGRARRLAKPRTLDELRACLDLDPGLRILGDGANLLVADAGVPELVVSLAEGDFGQFSIGQPDQKGYAIVRAGAGVHLFKLINACVDAGLAGLENLAGIPARVGGAIVMNAGGKYGSTGDYVSAVEVLTRPTSGAPPELKTLKRNQIEFSYRFCALTCQQSIVTHVHFRLRTADPAALRAKLAEVTAYKKSTQPLSANSAGCCFKNPTLTDHVPDIGTPGTRVSAGLLIDRAGCKGLKVGGASVSDQHANFIVAAPGCTAADIIELMRQVRARVDLAFGLTLEPEVVLWGASL
ncbi:MAG: UDP-N-acetylmuramate dehydrogenase [Phycisphaerae bacterium]|nr:UDP-N-acetylmuramate dehydrogenase [Phycisphaerae bacterium]